MFSTGGAPTWTLPEALQPLASVTVTPYTPGARPEMEAVVAPLLHAKA